MLDTPSAVSSSERVCCSAEPASSPIAAAIARTLTSAPSTICDCSPMPSSSWVWAIAPPSITASELPAVSCSSVPAPPSRSVSACSVPTKSRMP